MNPVTTEDEEISEGPRPGGRWAYRGESHCWYEITRRIHRLKVGAEAWVEGVEYRNTDGKLFIRDLPTFLKKFIPL